MKPVVCLFVLAVCGAQAQMLKIPASFDRLAAKAEEVTDITLDPATLGLAGRFLSDKSPDEAKAKKIAASLTSIYIRSYEFSKEGEYSEADVEALRSQLRGPGWSCVVNVRSKKKGENAQVCFLRGPNSFQGLAIVAAEPKQLTIISITGTVSPDQLKDLEGQFGIPKLDFDSKSKPKDEE